MSDEDFFKWLRSKGVNEKDCKTLSGKCVQCATDYIVINIAIIIIVWW